MVFHPEAQNSNYPYKYWDLALFRNLKCLDAGEVPLDRYDKGTRTKRVQIKKHVPW